MTFALTVDLGRTMHAFRLPPWIDTHHEARRFHQSLTDGLWAVEHLAIDGHYLAIVLHEDTEHGLAIPARDWDEASAVLEAAAVAQLSRVN
jgi:hypothetical protein